MAPDDLLERLPYAQASRAQSPAGYPLVVPGRQAQPRRQSLERVCPGPGGLLSRHAEEVLAARVRLQQVRLVGQGQSLGHAGVEGVEGRTAEAEGRVRALEERVLAALGAVGVGRVVAAGGGGGVDGGVVAAGGAGDGQEVRVVDRVGLHGRGPVDRVLLGLLVVVLVLE